MKKFFSKKVWPWVAHPIETAKMTLLRIVVKRAVEKLREGRKKEIRWIAGAFVNIATHLNRLADGEVKTGDIIGTAENAYSYFRKIVKRLKKG